MARRAGELYKRMYETNDEWKPMGIDHAQAILEECEECRDVRGETESLRLDACVSDREVIAASAAIEESSGGQAGMSSRGRFDGGEGLASEQIGVTGNVGAEREGPGLDPDGVPWLFSRWADWDGDGLSNFEETKVIGTNPGAWDTDGDGMSDDKEVARGQDPLTPQRRLARARRI